MGFLDKLLKKEAKKFVSGMVDKAVDNVMNGGSKNNVRLSGEAALRSRLEQVIANEYGAYELRQNVPASEMFAEYGAVDYSYGLYQNGAPVAFINIISNRNDYSLKRYRLAKEASVNRGVPHMNFFSHLPNESVYISQRLRKEIFG